MTQAGPFRLRYHVQDGGSADDTLARLAGWAERLRSGAFPPACDGIDFSYDSAPDAGMYAGIAAGFERCGPGGRYMSWVNADDVLMPGALSFVIRIFTQFPEVQLLGGRPCEMTEEGAITRIHDVQVYPQRTVRAGLHDGRRLPFVMQEGTFWRAELWRKAGGVRPDLRMAGDFDLWRRFAGHAPYVSADTLLAGHRRHGSQLTIPEIYQREVESVVAAEADAREREWTAFLAWRARSAAARDFSFAGPVLVAGGGEWRLETRSFPVALNTTVHISTDEEPCPVPASYVSGFGAEQGPYAYASLTRGFRELQGTAGLLRFHVPRDGRYRVRVRLRNFAPDTRAALLHGGSTVLEAPLPLTLHDRECSMSADTIFRGGANDLTLAVTGPADLASRVYILVIDCDATPLVGGTCAS